MTHFRTSFDLVPASFDVGHQHSILSVGSCFADNISARLKALKFKTLTNPFGILYNPISIQHCLQNIYENTAFSEENIVENNNQWHSWTHHSEHSKKDKQTLLNHLQYTSQNAHHFLQKTERIIVTLGTAYVWVRRENGAIVANCHKLPNTLFERKKLNVKEVYEALFSAFELLYSENKNLRITLTISPIRHIRDGIVENQRSKAVLLLAAEQLSQQLAYLDYFPAYELLLDDLRDYRFYADDMIHPSTVAVDYIWQHFQAAYFHENTQQLSAIIEKIKQASQHRPFAPHSEGHQRFLRIQLEKIAALEKKHPILDFSAEKRIFAEAII